MEDDLIYRTQALLKVIELLENEDYTKEMLLHDIQNLDAAGPRWISCTERLPQPLEEVIVSSEEGYVYTSRMVHGDFEYGGNIIAWMPLPAPYPQKENEA